MDFRKLSRGSSRFKTTLTMNLYQPFFKEPGGAVSRSRHRVMNLVHSELVRCELSNSKRDSRDRSVSATLRSATGLPDLVVSHELHSQLAAGLNEEDAEDEEDEDAPTARLRGRTRQLMVDDMARFSKSVSERVSD
jgi:hypothetical protein